MDRSITRAGRTLAAAAATFAITTLVSIGTTPARATAQAAAQATASRHDSHPQEPGIR